MYQHDDNESVPLEVYTRHVLQQLQTADFGSWSLERHPNLWSDWAAHPDIWVGDGFLGWCTLHHPAVVVEWRLFQSTTQQKTGD